MAATPNSNKTLIIVLCVIGAIILIIGGCVTTCALVVRKKAMDYSRQAQKNPTYAALSFAASVHPDIQIVSQDENTGKITLRNKRTGEKVTINTNDYTPENIGKALEQVSRGVKPVVDSSESKEEPAGPAAAPASRTRARVEPKTEENDASSSPAKEEEQAAPAQRAEKRISPARAAAQAAMLKKFPDFIPTYSGGKILDSTLNSVGGNTIGSYSFSTGDAPDVVADFYEKTFTDAGFTIATKESGANDNGATATLMANRADPQAVVTLSAEIDGGKTRVTVGFTRVGGK